jgi:hypothetical protein
MAWCGANDDGRYNHFPVDALGAGPVMGPVIGPVIGSAALGDVVGVGDESPATCTQRAVRTGCAPAFATNVTWTRPGDASE